VRWSPRSVANETERPIPPDKGIAWKGISEPPYRSDRGARLLVGKLDIRAGDGPWDKLIRFVARSVEHDRYAPKPVATPCYS
jgi:hypothetical protein